LFSGDLLETGMNETANIIAATRDAEIPKILVVSQGSTS
jgi:hypothetical protein